MGNKFPAEPERGYATAIGSALQSELGDGHRAAKTVMRWTSASERSAKNWLEGRRGRSGWHLILLIRKSDAVALAVMKLADREAVGGALALQTLRDAHAVAVQSIDRTLEQLRHH